MSLFWRKKAKNKKTNYINFGNKCLKMKEINLSGKSSIIIRNCNLILKEFPKKIKNYQTAV